MSIEDELKRARTLPSGEVMTDDRLREVFDLVKPQDNWKMPIDTYVSQECVTIEELLIAVPWFTGGLCHVRSVAGDGELLWGVQAEGYYNCIGS